MMRLWFSISPLSKKKNPRMGVTLQLATLIKKLLGGNDKSNSKKEVADKKEG